MPPHGTLYRIPQLHRALHLCSNSVSINRLIRNPLSKKRLCPDLQFGLSVNILIGPSHLLLFDQVCPQTMARMCYRPVMKRCPQPRQWYWILSHQLYAAWTRISKMINRSHRRKPTSLHVGLGQRKHAYTYVIFSLCAFLHLRQPVLIYATFIPKSHPCLLSVLGSELPVLYCPWFTIS